MIFFSASLNLLIIFILNSWKVVHLLNQMIFLFHILLQNAPRFILQSTKKMVRRRKKLIFSEKRNNIYGKRKDFLPYIASFFPWKSLNSKWISSVINIWKGSCLDWKEWGFCLKMLNNFLIIRSFLTQLSLVDHYIIVSIKPLLNLLMSPISVQFSSQKNLQNAVSTTFLLFTFLYENQ
jgi:hypothetical protein